MPHQHHLSPAEWVILGGALHWIVSGLTSTMPPYTGNSYGMKWLYAFGHWAGANLDKLHIPGSAADLASNPPQPPPPPPNPPRES